METGIEGRQTQIVTQALTAEAVGSGGLPVFATPSMIALMEKTAMQSVQPFLKDGDGTVGTAIDVQHVAATPVGMAVQCRSRLTKVDGRRLEFEIEASDAAGCIGRARHERFIVDNARFMQKAQAKTGGPDDACRE